MARTSDFKTALVGVHDLTINGGSALTRRSGLNIIGQKVEDTGSVLQLTPRFEPVWAPQDSLTGSVNDYGPTGFASASELPIVLDGNYNITGFDSTGLTVLEKRIWNMDTSNSFTLVNDSASSQSQNRIGIPGGGPTLAFTAGEVARIVYDSGTGNWWAFKCLA